MSVWIATFTFHSWWRIGSGVGRGGELDELVARSPDKLPWIPGKTIKGLVREALQELEDFGQIGLGITEMICGSALTSNNKSKSENNYTANRKRYVTEKGLLRFGSAEMLKEWRDWAGSNDGKSEIIDALFDKRNMTAINEEGIAKHNSLRSVEVCAPMVLKAQIQSFSNEDVSKDISDALEKCGALIRRVARGRNRGFGRVSVIITPLIDGGKNDK